MSLCLLIPLPSGLSTRPFFFLDSRPAFIPTTAAAAPPAAAMLSCFCFRFSLFSLLPVLKKSYVEYVYLPKYSELFAVSIGFYILRKLQQNSQSQTCLCLSPNKHSGFPNTDDVHKVDLTSVNQYPTQTKIQGCKAPKMSTPGQSCFQIKRARCSRLVYISISSLRPPKAI